MHDSKSIHTLEFNLHEAVFVVAMIPAHWANSWFELRGKMVGCEFQIGIQVRISGHTFDV